MSDPVRPAVPHPYAEGTPVRLQHDVEVRDAVIRYFTAREQALAALVAQWRARHPMRPESRVDDDYWAGQSHAVNRCADELAALLEPGSEG